LPWWWAAGCRWSTWGIWLLVGPITVGLLIKLALNYLTPFVVANLGLLSRAKAPPQ
jgi:hypothetical protein